MSDIYAAYQSAENGELLQKLTLPLDNCKKLPPPVLPADNPTEVHVPLEYLKIPLSGEVTNIAPPCFLTTEAENNPHFYLMTPRYGGHVGFVSNDKVYWSEQQILKFLEGVGLNF